MQVAEAGLSPHPKAAVHEPFEVSKVTTTWLVEAVWLCSFSVARVAATTCSYMSRLHERKLLPV